MARGAPWILDGLSILSAAWGRYSGTSWGKAPILDVSVIRRLGMDDLLRVRLNPFWAMEGAALFRPPFLLFTPLYQIDPVGVRRERAARLCGY
jgi:hypothetical protein